MGDNMDLEEFGQLKTPHLITLAFCVLVAGLTTAYGIYAFTRPINTRSECCRVSSEPQNGTSINQKDQPSLSKGGNIFCGSSRAF